MAASDALLFIDANKYLDLYETHTGSDVVKALGEQAEYIFVTQRVVEEVHRRKIGVAAGFIGREFKQVEVKTFTLPDHLFCGVKSQRDEIRKLMKEIEGNAKKVKKLVNAFATSIIEAISKSDDEVSKVLAPIFDAAVKHSPEELERARERREFGNPPGKPDGTIGDQLTWEQILTQCKGKRRVWIVSRDGDYGTSLQKKGYLNQYLHHELRKVSTECESYFFTSTIDGIQHFIRETGVKAEKLPKPDVIKEIKKEEDSLPVLPRSPVSIKEYFEGYRQAHDNMKKAFLDPPVNLRQLLRAMEAGEASKVAVPEKEWIIRDVIATMRQMTEESKGAGKKTEEQKDKSSPDKETLDAPEGSK